jgi:hypothetical protein
MATKRKATAKRKSASKSKTTKRKSRSQNAAEPWDKPPPKNKRHTKLTPAKKAAAKRSAKRAGRRYPNLVDNMRQASKKG